MLVRHFVPVATRCARRGASGGGYLDEKETEWVVKEAGFKPDQR